MQTLLFERLLALVLLIVLAPVLALFALLTKFSSPGPVIFRQVRIGFAGRTFTIYKFRTMRHNSGSGHPKDWVTGKHDPRITRTGRMLRATHLDELPQLWNIVRGDMAFIGPRPVSVEEKALFENLFADFPERFEVLPGLTGLGQLLRDNKHNVRAVERYINVDRYYFRHGGFRLNAYILVRTMRAVLSAKSM